MGAADRHSRPRGRELFPHRLAFAPAPLGKGSRDGRASFWQMGVSLLAHLFSRSEEHTSELQSLMRISYAVFCLKKKNEHTSTEPAHICTNTYPSIYLKIFFIIHMQPC